MISVLALGGAGILKFPSASVVADILVPLTATVAAGRTFPLSSFTVPVIVLDCAKTCGIIAAASNRATVRFRINFLIVKQFRTKHKSFIDNKFMLFYPTIALCSPIRLKPYL